MVTLHLCIAAVTEEPLFLIDETEAKLLSDAIAKTANAFDVGAVLSPKAQALIDLSLAAGIVYGPRFMKLAQKRKRTGKVQIIPPAQQPTQHVNGSVAPN